MIIKNNKFVFVVAILLVALLIPAFQQNLLAGCGTTWKNGSVTAEVTFRDIVYANGFFLAVGDGGIVYKSYNGNSWSKISSGFSSSDHIFGLAYGNGYFVGAMRDKRIVRGDSDGKNWSVKYNGGGTEDLYGAAYGNGMFVVIGESGSVYTSTNDGVSWSKTSTGYPLRAIKYGAGIFVAGTGGGQPKILTSTDGKTWKQRYTPASNIRGIAFSGTKWIAVGYDVYLCQEPDAINWTRSLRGSKFSLVDQFYSGFGSDALGLFVAAGEHGLLFTSPDAINWTKRVSGTQRFLLAMAYGNGVISAVGNGGPREPNSVYLYSTHYSECGGSGPGALTVSSPNGGEEWEAGSSHDVNWYSSGSVGNVKLEYSVDNGASWILFDAVAKNDGNRPWVVPDEESDQCLVKITSVDSPSIYDISDKPFTIFGGTPPTLTVTAPNGGEAWIVGTGHIISWTTTGIVSRVNIDYSTDNGTTWKSISTDRANTGEKYWVVPDDISTEAKVRVSSTSSSSVVDESDEVFSIEPSYVTPTIKVTVPNGGEDWEAGEKQDIKWSNTGTLVTVKIDYSTDNGTTWKQVTDFTGNDGIYSWTIPEDPSTRCKIRVTDESGKSDASDTSNSSFTITSALPAELALNRTTYNFGYALGGGFPGGQPLTLSNAGGKPLNWTSEADQTWLVTDPTSGMGSAVVNINIEPTALTRGEYSGIITINDPAATNSPQTAEVRLKVINQSEDKPPFGDMSSPDDGITVSGSIPVTGWVLDDIDVQSVKIYYNEGSYIGDAVFVEGARPDIELSYPDYPNNYRAGWGYMLLTNSLPDGVYSLYAIATDNAGKTIKFGPKTVTIDNATAVKPFGALDTPAQGGEASGENYVNWGWALTPQPNTIPKDGSTIKLYIDGILLGTSYQYDIPNEGVAGLFPGLNNSEGPTAFFYIDTYAYENGVHLIAWTVSDDADNAEGIGSRYFTIRNSMSGTSAAARAAARGILKGEELSAAPSSPSNFLQIQKGFSREIDSRDTVTGERGIIHLESRELERIELQAGNGSKFTTGYQLIGGEIRPLPLGSTLNPDTGTFSWIAGVGFVGEYHLVLIAVDEEKLQTKTDIIITIHPK